VTLGKTTVEKTKAITILVPGQLHPRAVEALNAAFDLASIEAADPTLVTNALREKVRGIACSSGISAEFIDSFPGLEIVASFGVGYDSVDASHAGKVGVMVTNTPDVLTEEVADTALGLLLNTVRELPKAEAWLRDGRWEDDGNYPLTEMTLRDRTAGIFGMGRIGRAIARRLEAFGVGVHYHNRRKIDDAPHTYHDSLVGLAAAVDTLIVVAPADASTFKAVNVPVLKALGPNGVLINIARGSLVDEQSLIVALSDGTIAAAGLDVFEDEPHVPAELVALPNACLLPHVGTASVHTREVMAQLVVDNILGWFTEGEAVTPVAETAHVSITGENQQ